jgi:hypothetical protein
MTNVLEGKLQREAGPGSRQSRYNMAQGAIPQLTSPATKPTGTALQWKTYTTAHSTPFTPDSDFFFVNNVTKNNSARAQANAVRSSVTCLFDAVFDYIIFFNRCVYARLNA